MAEEGRRSRSRHSENTPLPRARVREAPEYNTTAARADPSRTLARGVGIEPQVVGIGEHWSKARRRGDHGRVVGAEDARRHMHARPDSLEAPSQLSVGCHASTDGEATETCAS